MEARKPVFGKSNSVEDMQHVRLMALLQELEREHGRKGAAAVLGLDHRTLGASLDEGVLSRRVRGALERALQEGIGSAADRQRERNDGLEKRLEELEGVVEAQGKEMRVGRRALEDAMRAVREEQAKALRELETRLAQPRTDGSAQGDATPPRPGQPRRRATLRREFPDLVTREPAEDDEEVFADAWPLIGEWREMKAAHPSRGGGPSWLATQERLLTVELALLEGARDDASPGDVPAAGLRTGRPDRLAKDRALRHAESAGKVGATPARSHPVAVAEVAGSRRGGSPSTFVNTLAAICGRGPASPLIEAPGRAIMTALFGFLQGFRP